jgi:hypothetical protein
MAGCHGTISIFRGVFLIVMRSNPQQRAWTVLLTTFGIFFLLAVSIPLTIRWYLLTATESRPTQLEVISGTVLVDSPGQSSPTGVTDSGQIPVQGRAKTDSTSWASLTFFDDSNAVLYSKTDVEIQEARSPQFRFSQEPDVVSLGVNSGRVRLDVRPTGNRSRVFKVQTPHGAAELQPGSYSVEVNGQGTEIAVREGWALVSNSGDGVKVSRGERTTVAEGKQPAQPVAASRDLVTNGDFQEGLDEWSVYNEQGADGGVVNGQVEAVSSGDRPAVRLSRMGEDGNHCETGIVQELDRDVRDFTSLKFHADVQLLYQSLSGGGYLSSEFPIILRLDYKDQYGIDRFWTHGFYYQNDSNFAIQNGQQIPRYRWFPYESGNLMAELGNIKPNFITSVRIYASGWNYQSMVSEVGVIVE